MGYASPIKEKLPIGSGVTEAACKTLLKQRFCCSGVRWKETGIKAVMSLRALVLTKGRRAFKVENQSVWSTLSLKLTLLKGRNLRTLADLLDFLVFINNTEKIQSDDFFIGKAEVCMSATVVKKAHTMKNNIIAGLEDRQIKYLGKTWSGKVHDKKMADEEGVKFPEGYEVYRGLGFRGT